MRRANWTKGPPDKGKKRIIKAQSEWVYSRIEPIISEELWDKCNAVLDELEKKNKRPAKKAVQLFAGYVQCVCGQAMYVPSNTPKYVCYKCRNKIGTADLEGIFHEQLKTFFFSPEEIAKYLSQADQTIKEKENLLKTLNDQRKKTEQDMEKIFRAYTNDEITMEAFGRHYRPLEERLKQIDGQIPEVQGEVDLLKIQSFLRPDIHRSQRPLFPLESINI